MPKQAHKSLFYSELQLAERVGFGPLGTEEFQEFSAKTSARNARTSESSRWRLNSGPPRPFNWSKPSPPLPFRTHRSFRQVMARHPRLRRNHGTRALEDCASSPWPGGLCLSSPLVSHYRPGGCRVGEMLDRFTDDLELRSTAFSRMRSAINWSRDNRVRLDIADGVTDVTEGEALVLHSGRASARICRRTAG